MAGRTKKKKITSNNWLSINPFTLDAMTVENLRRKAAKQANQRLLRLERHKVSTGERLAEISEIAQYAYKQIEEIKRQADVQGRGKKLRFREQSLPLGETQARMELYVLQNFLADDRSKAGNAARYVSKTEKIFMDRGISVASYKSFYNFLNSGAFSELKADGIDSDDIVEIYNNAHESGKKSFAWINNAIATYISDQESAEKNFDQRGLAQALGVNALR